MNPPHSADTPSEADTPGQKARALLKTLHADFAVFRDYSPLAIGIDKPLMACRPELERKILRIALSMHTNSLRYLKTLELSTHRVDLEGNPGQEIPQEHKDYARETLRERSKKEIERRKALREAEAQEKQRQQKLSQLVEKFGKTR